MSRTFFTKSLFLNTKNKAFYSEKSANASAVYHDVKQNKFRLSLPSSTRESFLNYKIIDGRTMDLQYVETPTEFRGHGVAKRLVVAALNFGTENKFKMIPTCPYVRKYVNENPSPKYSHLMTTKPSTV